MATKTKPKKKAAKKSPSSKRRIPTVEDPPENLNVSITVGDRTVTTDSATIKQIADNLRNGETNGHHESAPDSPADPTGNEAQLADFKARIEAAELECEQREAEWLSAKESAKEAKAVFEGAVASLRQLIRRANDPQRQLPMQSDGPAAPDAWRSASIDCLFLKPGVVKLADYTASNDGLNGVAGIGTAARETVSEALDKYWSEHPQAESDQGELFGDGYEEDDGEEE